MKTKFIASIISIILVTALLIAGNANALTVDIKPSNDRATAGEVINFHITLERENNEPINSLTFSLAGPESRTCNFDINGNPVSGCDGITIKRLTEDIGYGPSKFLKYKISLDSSQFVPGTYTAKMSAVSNGSTIEESTTITIKPKKK